VAQAKLDARKEDRVEAPRHTSALLHRLLIDSVADYAIFALDAAGHVLSWNTGAERLKGYATDEIIGTHFSIFFPSADVEAGRPSRELVDAARDGRTEDEGWRVRKDGTRFWANVVITALRDDRGDLIGFAKVTRDLTERREGERRATELAAERAAREAAERHTEELAGLTSQLQALFTAMRETADRASRLQSVTAGLASVVTADAVAAAVVREGIAALSAADGVFCLLTDAGDELEIVLATGLRDDTTRVFRRFPVNAPLPLSDTVRTGSPVFLESKADVVRHYPSLREANASASTEAWMTLPLTTAGKVVGGLAFGFTEARRFSESDRGFATALAQQASLALERARLYAGEQAARAEAEAANRTKSDFLATMSHELRTPLNAIAGYAELLEMGIHGELSDPQREALRRIRRSQRHLLSLIEDILDFARIEAGRVSMRTADVLVRDLIAGLEPMIEPQLRAKSLHFDVADPEMPLTARADPEKARQILLNLLSNAIKFTPAGGTIAVGASGRGDRVEIVVRDTGVGIAPGQQAEIFEPFVQLGRTLSNTPEGAGLGLAISRDLARAMGGELTVESSPGAGAAFTLSLPRAPV
jgi:PAS domain S-box-containing protein